MYDKTLFMCLLVCVILESLLAQQHSWLIPCEGGNSMHQSSGLQLIRAVHALDGRRL